MYANSISCGDQSLSVNAYHVEIRVKGVTVFKRGHDSKVEWLDAKHRAITDALDALEKAVKDAAIVKEGQ